MGELSAREALYEEITTLEVLSGKNKSFPIRQNTPIIQINSYFVIEIKSPKRTDFHAAPQ